MKNMIRNFKNLISIIVSLNLFICSMPWGVLAEEFLALPGESELLQSVVQKKNPESNETLLNEIIALSETPEKSNSRSLYKELPTSSAVKKLVQRARTKNNKEALPLLRRARRLHLHPRKGRKYPYENLVVLNNLAENYFYLGDYEKAMRYAKLSILTAQKLTDDFNYRQYLSSVRHNHAVAYGIRSQIYSAMGKISDARIAAKKSTEIDSHNVFSWGLFSTALLMSGEAEEALAAADKYIKLEPKMSTGWKHKSNALLAIGYKTFIINGRKAARIFSFKKLKELSSDKKKYSFALMRWLYRMASPRRGMIPIPAALLDEIIDHIMLDHTAKNEKSEDLKSLFPDQFIKREELVTLLKRSIHSLKTGRTIRKLPYGMELNWWEKDIFVAYIPMGDSGELMRIIVIGNKKGEVVTAYPTFGPGVAYWRGLNVFPIELISAVPGNSLIWNKRTGDPIHILMGNKEYGFIKMIKSPQLSNLYPIEREQLIWQTAVEGKKYYEDDDARYYKYKIPQKGRRCRWKEKLKTNYVYLKVNAQTLRAIEILTKEPTLLENKGTAGNNRSVRTSK